MRIKFYLIIFVFVSNCLLATAQITAYQYEAQKNITVSRAAVVSAHTLASQAGESILKKGGNAIDAAIATQFALAVVYPGAGNIGGGGFMVAHLKNGKDFSLDYRETAPAAAFKDMYLDAAGNAVTAMSQWGYKACGVPGTVAGLFAALPYAKFKMPVLMAPAIQLAEKGFVITKEEAASLNSARKDFMDLNKEPIAFVKKELWKGGDTLIQPQLAATLTRISKLGASGFYEGATALMIQNGLQKNGGIISLDDLKNYKAKFRDPIRFNYRGYQIISMPLPSSGGIILQQVLKMIENKDVQALQFQSAASVQLLVEAERRAFADRAQYMGDADFVQVPVKQLLEDTYLQKRISDYIPGKAGNSKETEAGIIPEHEETTHISILDAEGNAVSVTTTLNGSYGSRVVIAGAGFIMNNEMDDFSIKEGVPNMYGAVGNAANAIAPGKRMLSSMTPTLVLKNKKPFIVVGTPGGTTIPTSVIQSLVNIIDFKMNAADAVNKPKFHHQWLPDVIYIEKGFSPAVADSLRNMGYTLQTRSAIGRTELIKINPTQKKKIEAVADHRGDDDARGY
ncbi:MAG: gamma-glutamyltransferase [Niastella sp. SCN 39-18]|nr:gamma-glutamyltransferase [Sphingobacteriales bacterium]ODT55143.1 MAG: gamma-glutamyltransferase [Niastella sp. SCN 39-18]OJW09194.1 MAG: gamma-glutamyltransferase [Sphingobacteriales bacterium 39-19]